MKNTILKTITVLSVLLTILAISAIDSVSCVPLIVFFCCLAWLCSFIGLNADYLRERGWLY